MQEEKGKMHSVAVRLDEPTFNKLAMIELNRGINKSEAIRLCINSSKIVQVGNVKDFAAELYKIRMALECGGAESDIRKEIDRLCQYIYDLITKTEGVEE